jgi:hypothetical protein
LLNDEWLICTRHGRRNRCALYAVSWWPIDDCEGKWLEVGPEKSASNPWQKTKSLGAMRTNGHAEGVENGQKRPRRRYVNQSCDEIFANVSAIRTPL